jgi:hypothetical protein
MSATATKLPRKDAAKEKGGGYYTDTCNDSNFLQMILGGVVLIVFLLIWISSVASPILFYLSLRYGHYGHCTIMLFFTACAFLPWRKGFFSKLVTAFARRNTNYYTQCTTVFESSSSLPHPGGSQNPNSTPFIHMVHFVSAGRYSSLT